MQTLTNQTPILPNIKISAPNMTPTLQRLAGFILKYPNETTRLSVEELATQASVSVASIYRFCREMDYQTFSHLKLAIARELTTDKDTSSQTSGSPQAETLFDEYAEKILETARFLNPETLASVVDLILRSKRIVLVGLGASGTAASFLHYKLLRAGIACHRPLDMHLATMLASGLGPNDLLIAFSASGATRDIVDLCTLARNSGTPLIGITSRRKNPVEHLSSLHLIAVASDSPITSGSGASVISQIALADNIYQALYMRDESIRKRIGLTTDTIISKLL